MRIFAHDNMKNHVAPQGFPECAERVDAIMAMLKASFPDIAIEACTPAAEDILRLAHSQAHIDSLKTQEAFLIGGETPVTQHTYNAARLAAGAAMNAVDAVLSGSTKTAFALSRPPGHHASQDQAEGFCLLNNVFIAARYAIDTDPSTRILIIDFDVHHGNGTEALLQNYLIQGGKNIAYGSVHQEGIYPGTGYQQSEYIYNCPLLSGCGSSDFRDAVTYDILPFAERFQPEIILYSAGFDGHQDDPLAGLNYTHDDYAWIVQQFQGLCDKQVSVLEGGYNLEALPVSVYHHLKALADM